MKLDLQINMRLTNSKDTGMGTVEDKSLIQRGVEVSDDSSATYSADTSYYETRTLADAANETLDIQDGTLEDPIFGAVAIVKLKVIYIKNNSDDASLLIGGAASNALGLFNDVSDILKLRPGGEYVFTAPDSTGIDTSTNASLKLEHDGTGSSSLDYDILIAGDSA